MLALLAVVLSCALHSWCLTALSVADEADLRPWAALRWDALSFDEVKHGFQRRAEYYIGSTSLPIITGPHLEVGFSALDARFYHQATSHSAQDLWRLNNGFYTVHQTRETNG